MNSQNQLSNSLVALVLGTIILLGVVTIPSAISQASDLVISSYHTFSLLSGIYRSNGAAPELVAEFNMALEQMQEASIKRAQGDEVGAGQLDEQARSAFAQIESAVPAAQENAERDSGTRMLLAVAFIPLAVTVSTFAFYLALRVWRRYEMLKLYEMKIIEKKKAED